MKLVWHLAKADLRHLRWPLVVWALAVLLNIASNAYLLTLPMPTRWPAVLATFLAPLSSITRWGLTVALAGQVILIDPLRNSTAFRLTRPISGGRLLAAKAGVLSLLAFAPALANPVVLAALGMTGRVLAVGLLESAAVGGVAVMSAAVFAVVTDTFGSFVLRAIMILAAGGFAAAFAAGMYRMGHLVGGGPPLSGSLTASGWWAFKIAVLAGGAAFVSWQYLQRHLRLGFLIAFLGTMLVMVLPSCWQWDFLGGRPAAIAVHPTFGLQSPVLVRAPSFHDLVTLQGEVQCAAQGDGCIFEPTLAATETTLAWPGKPRLVVTSILPSYEEPLDPMGMEPATLLRFLAPARLLNPAPKSAHVLTLLNAGREVVQRLAREPATLRAKVIARVWRFTAEGELPAVAGGGEKGPSWRMRVDRVEIAGGEIRLSLREAAFLSYLVGERDPATMALIVPLLGREQDVLYVLVNRVKGEALLPRPSPAYFTTEHFGHLFAWHRYLDFATDPLGARPEEWLRGAVLLRVRLEDLGQVTCPLQAEGVTAKL